MAEYSSCTEPTCATTVEGRLEACPKCGRPMRRLGESKVRAFFLIATGLFLIGFMGWIWATLWPTLRRPGADVDGSRFTGSADDAQLIELLFGSVVLFGIVGLAYGIYMLTSGRESAGFKKALLGLVALLFAIGGFIRYALG
jgi:hypothetical protein